MVQNYLHAGCIGNSNEVSMLSINAFESLAVWFSSISYPFLTHIQNSVAPVGLPFLHHSQTLTTHYLTCCQYHYMTPLQNQLCDGRNNKQLLLTIPGWQSNEVAKEFTSVTSSARMQGNLRAISMTLQVHLPLTSNVEVELIEESTI